jgi:DNA sulfur modification protein DndD
MRIERLLLKNYRQFRETEFLFEPVPGNDLSVIIGKNGTGKTNILNAINWCLYGDEPHLSKESQQVPILNLKCIEEFSDANRQAVVVKIWAQTDDKKNIAFAREHTFESLTDEKVPVLHQTSFEVEVQDERGNTDIVLDDKAESYVERFVPKRIREFFFFDGERLDKYFKEATAQNIKHAIFDISQIDLLERIEDRLHAVLSELRKQAGKQNPEIENARSNLEKATEEHKQVTLDIEEKKKQILIAKEKIEEYNDKLKGMPIVEDLSEERERLRKERERKNKFHEEKLKAKHELLFQYSIVLSLWPAIDESLIIVRQKKASGEIPPTIDKALLESIAEERICSICGRPIEGDSLQHVTDLVEGLRLSSLIAQELMGMESSLVSLEDDIDDFEKKIESCTNEVKSYESELEIIEKRLGEIDKELGGYDEEKIRDWHKELKNFEDILERNQKSLYLLQERDERLTKAEETFQKILDDELKKEGRANELAAQLSFTADALKTIQETKESIMLDTKTRIEAQTKNLFSSLLWKKDTFGGVTIGDDYSINLIHKMGYECLGTVSAAERELLALSFTLALHNVSGFSSPVLIDTPVARISDVHRKRFGEVLLSISEDKQIILLFTPSEYSSEISGLFDQKSSHRYALKLQAGEKETRAERL